MDFEISPAALLASLIIGSVGFAIFLRGKREGEIKPLVFGIGLMGTPYIVPGALAMCLVSAAILGGAWAWERWA